MSRVTIEGEREGRRREGGIEDKDEKKRERDTC